MLSILAVAWVATAPIPPTDPVQTTGVANPAVTQDTIQQTICKPDWTKTVRPPDSFTTKLKAAQLPPGSDLHDWEEDHVWPIEDGGSPTDPNNLRPQLWVRSDGAGARAKDDQVETPVHRAICSGKMTLDQGHAVIAAWIEAHKPYPIIRSSP